MLALFASPLWRLYMRQGHSPTIGIAKSISNNERKVRSVLAEELGHHFTSVGNYLGPYYCYADQLYVSKAERLAMKWACDILIPDKELDELLAWPNWCIEDLTEHFAVTRKIIHCKLMFRREEIEVEMDRVAEAKAGYL